MDTDGEARQLAGIVSGLTLPNHETELILGVKMFEDVFLALYLSLIGDATE